MSIRRRAAAVAGALALGLALAAAGPSLGATATASGWWTSTPGAPAPLNTTANPAAPGPGQLGVSATPAGATSIAAVRFLLDPGEAPKTLSLAIAGGTAQSAIVVACPAAGGWSADAGGPLTDAPTASCGGHQSIAEVTADNLLRFPLDAGFVTGDAVDLVIAPGAVDVGGQKLTPTFSLTLTAPDSAALATTTVPVGIAEPEPEPAPTTPPFDPAVADDPFLGIDPGASASYDPPVPSGVLEPGPVRAPVARAPQVVPAPGVALGPTRRASDNSNADDNRAQRFGLLLFPLAVLGAIWALNTSTPALHGIGRLAHAASGAGPTESGSGGLARFRRERTEPPVPLR